MPAVPGSAPSESARYRRRSTIVSTMSMNAGQASTHAMQVVHAQSSWAVIVSPWMARPFASCISPRSFRMICFGDSGVPARCAGQTSWQRPHIVQASKSRRRFQENSSSFETPSVSASSMFRIGVRAPGGRELHEERVERRRDQVDEVGVRDQRDEAEGDREVEEPGPEVEAAERALPHPDGEERLPQRPADRRPRRPPRLHHREPARLQHEARHVDGEEEGEDPREVGRRVDPGRARRRTGGRAPARAPPRRRARTGRATARRRGRTAPGGA